MVLQVFRITSYNVCYTKLLRNVHVLAGNYTESFTIYKSLNLLGEGVDHSAVLSGLINITGNDIALDGLRNNFV